MPDSQSATVEASEAAPETLGTGATAGSDRRLAIGTQENITRKLLLCFRELAKSIDSLERRTAKTENKHGDYSRSITAAERKT